MRPVAIAGLGLLVLTAALLLLARFEYAGNIAALETWIVALGLLLLIGAGVATARVGRHVVSPAAPAPLSETSLEAPPVAAPEANPGARTGGPGSSIPASYLAAMYNPPVGDEVPPLDFPEPITAALPFAALPRLSPHEGGGTFAEAGGLSLDVELARLRARVHELEMDRALDAPPPWFAARSGASTSLVALTASGAPAPPGGIRPVGGTGCVGCGIAVPAQAPDGLCGGCGRPLCVSCGGPPGATPGARQCPDCQRQARLGGAVSVSAGRAATPTMLSDHSPLDGRR